MSNSEDLARLFILHLSEAQRPRAVDSPHLHQVLADILETARYAWPKISLPAEVFLPFLAKRVQEGGPLLEALKDLRASDLYLACACSRGDDRALALFDEHFTPRIEMSLARLRLSDSSVAEIKQMLSKKLFVTEDEAPPRIASYAGSGSLDAWVRVTAIRMALRLMQKEKKDVLADTQMIDALSPQSDDPELKYLKKRYRREFKEAFGQAMESLSGRERTLLRLHILDQLNIDQIGVFYQVHRATAARWLTDTRQTVATRTQSIMMKHLQIQREDYESILRLIESQIDLSISQYLITSADGDGG